MKRYALCIGNNDYIYDSMRSLTSAVADAKSIAEKLVSLGFDVDIEYNLDSRGMVKKIAILEQKILKYDTILFYYAGHGFEVDGTNLIAPIDLNPLDDKALIKHTAYQISDLMHLLESADESTRKITKIIILDACRGGLNSRGENDSFAAITAPQGSIIAFSTSPGQMAIEHNDHGLYTKTLLEYMDEPRISIESVFKKVRVSLVQQTNGTQVPWEHTSLIGEFYLNPETIYGGFKYSDLALADKDYVCSTQSVLKSVIDLVRGNDYYTQQDGIRKLKTIPMEDIDGCSLNDLFVLGRKIYQSACGGCWESQGFIDGFSKHSFISNTAKLHVLNGLAFEIYYNSSGLPRRGSKFEYAESVFELLKDEKFFGSQLFIASKLENEDQIVFYIPGQTDKVVVDVQLIEVTDELSHTEDYGDEKHIFRVDDICFRDECIYYDIFSDEKAVVDSEYELKSQKEFETILRRKMAVAKGCLVVRYSDPHVNNSSVMQLPYLGFNIRPSDD